jgi:hypothetical protein
VNIDGWFYMNNSDLSLDLDEIIEELKKQEEEGHIFLGSTALSFIRKNVAGKIIDSENLLAEIDDRIVNIGKPCPTEDDDFYRGQEDALKSLFEWVKGKV